MNNKPLRPCKHPGCSMLVSGGYCDAHKPRDDDRSDDAKAWRRFYLTDTWTQDLRPEQLLRQPFCEECDKRGLRVRATDVDHIVDHKGDWAVFTDRKNLRSLCHSCHSRKTLRDLREKRGGKSSGCRAVAR